MQRMSWNIKLIGLVISVLSVVGCDSVIDMSTPSQVNLRQVRITDSFETEVMEVNHIRPDHLTAIANKYKSHGEGALFIVVSYETGKERAAASARKTAQHLQHVFTEKGLKDIHISTVDMEDKTKAGRVVLSWASKDVLPPEGCRPIPGHKGALTLGEVSDYPMGCAVQTSFSKMIIDPTDVMGQGGGPTEGDSRRQGAIVEGYMSGTPNERMDEGLQASGIGSGTE